MAQSRSGGSRGGAGRAGARARSAGGAAGRAGGTSSRGSAPKSSGARKTTSRSAAKSSSKSGARGAGSRSAAAKKGGQARARKQTARRASSGAAKTAARGAGKAGVEAKTVAEFRAALRKNLMKPMDMVLLSRDRIEEVLGEAVDQGRINARDAQRITSGLVKRGQKQTSDVLKDLESLFDRGAGAAKGARGRAVRRASPALKHVDRVRRGAGVGASFPITGYGELTASQVQRRLSDLTPAQLRKVRDHERRNANRKTVLNAIASKLG